MPQNLDNEQVSRLWQLAMHSQNRFDNRLNFFLIFESLLLGVVGMLYGKADLTKPVLITIICLGFFLTILWGYTQAREKYLFDGIVLQVKDVDPVYRDIAAKRQEKMWPIGSVLLLTYGIPGLLGVVWIVLFIFALL